MSSSSPSDAHIILTRTFDVGSGGSCTEKYFFWLDTAHTIERLAHCPFLNSPQKRQWFVDSFCGGYESLKCSGGLNALGSICKQLIDCDSGGAVGQISRALLVFDAVTLNWNAICASETKFAQACRSKVASWRSDMTPLYSRYGFMIAEGSLPIVYPLQNADAASESIFERGRRQCVSTRQRFYLTLSEECFGGHSNLVDRPRLAAARCVRLFERRRDAEDFCETFDSSLGVELCIVGIEAEAPASLPDAPEAPPLSSPDEPAPLPDAPEAPPSSSPDEPATPADSDLLGGQLFHMP